MAPEEDSPADETTATDHEEVSVVDTEAKAAVDLEEAVLTNHDSQAARGKCTKQRALHAAKNAKCHSNQPKANQSTVKSVL